MVDPLAGAKVDVTAASMAVLRVERWVASMVSSTVDTMVERWVESLADS